MQARLVQLAARYIGVALLAIAGLIAGEQPLDEQTIAATADNAMAIATAIGGGLSLLVDQIIHRITHGSNIINPKGGRL